MPPSDPPRPLKPGEIAAANAEAEAELQRWMQSRAGAAKPVPHANAEPPAADPKTIAKLAGALSRKLSTAVRPPAQPARPVQPAAGNSPTRPRAGDVRARDRVEADLKKIAFHARRAHESAGDPGEAEDHWCAVETALAGFVRRGGLVSDAALVAALAPYRDALADDAEPSALLCEALGLPVPAPESGAHVLAARDLIAGSPVVLIGGTPRPNVKAALEEQLLIPEVRWLDSRPHQSTSTFEAAIRRAEVRIVLLAIRWSSHSYAADIPALCARAGKRCVRLPGGMGASQVAHQIVGQIGG